MEQDLDSSFNEELPSLEHVGFVIYIHTPINISGVYAYNNWWSKFCAVTSSPVPVTSLPSPSRADSWWDFHQHLHSAILADEPHQTGMTAAPVTILRNDHSHSSSVLDTVGCYDQLQ